MGNGCLLTHANGGASLKSDMQVPLLLLADYANATKDGKLNIMGTFSLMGVKDFPAVHPKMVVVVVFRAERTESGTFTLSIQLMDEDGKTVFKAEGHIEIPDGVFKEKNMQQIFELTGVRFEKPGDYSLIALVNGEERQRYSLRVVKAEEGRPNVKDKG